MGALAYTSWIQGKSEDSVALYERILEANPNNTTALNGLGYVLACLDKDLTRALTLCKKAVDMNPDNPAFLDSLGWVYYKLGLYKEAKNYIKRARDKDSKSSEIAEHFSAINLLESEGKILK